MSHQVFRGRLRSLLIVSFALVAAQVGAEESHPRRDVPLEELLAYADGHAPSLAASVQRQGYAAAERAGVDPLFLANPTLEFGLGPRFDAGIDLDFDFFASLAQPMGVAREREVRREAALRMKDRLHAETASMVLGLRREVTLLYRAAVIGRERQRLAERRAIFAREMLEIAEKRLLAGDVTLVDVRVTEAELVTARQRELAAEEEYRVLCIRLAEVSGWPLEVPLDVTMGLDELEPAPSIDALTRAALDRHPELRARRATVAEVQTRITVAKREAVPKPVFGARVAREGSAGSPANYIVLGTVGLSLPVWQKNQAERLRLQVDEDVARTEASFAARSLRARVARAHVALSVAIEQLALFSSSALPSLEASAKLLDRGFEAGELSLLNVAVARERFFAIEQQALDARAEYYRALTELEFLVGGPLGSTASTAAGGGAS